MPFILSIQDKQKLVHNNNFSIIYLQKRKQLSYTITFVVFCHIQIDPEDEEAGKKRKRKRAEKSATKKNPETHCKVHFSLQKDQAEVHSLFFYFILTIFHYLWFKDGNESNDKATANGIKQSSGNSDEVGLILCCMDSWILMRISCGI